MSYRKGYTRNDVQRISDAFYDYYAAMNRWIAALADKSEPKRKTPTKKSKRTPRKVKP